MSKQHQAVFLDEAKKPFRTGPIETKSPGKGEVLIRSKAIAINPVDWKVQETGYFISSWPAILGEDVAGEVVEVGEGVTRVKPGQRVIAHAIFLMNKVLQHASFQELVLALEDSVSPIPDNIKFEDAAVLPLAISTAAAGLYQSKNQSFLELDLPSHNSKKTGKTVLIWGGSSSVGSAAIQLATASGATVITTCSPRNNDFVTKLGAKPFDYNSPSIVGDLIDELKKGEFAGAYDTIGSRESGRQTAQVVTAFGGGFMADVLPPPEDIAANVKGGMVFAPSIFMGNNAHVGKAVWTDFIPQALASGQFVTAPQAEVVGHGLDAIQDACLKQKAGVSARKIVVTV